jgi:antitoxin PrlF
MLQYGYILRSHGGYGMKAIVAERGQVTIPKLLRDRLGIGPRTVLEFREEHGRLVAEKVTQSDPVSRVTGCLNLDRPTDEIIDEMRG